MSNEMKACPFCGKMPLVTVGHGIPDWVMVRCHTRDCLGSFAWARADLVANMWNARPIEDALRGKVERLTAELKAVREAVRWIPVGERLPEHDRPVLLLSRHPLSTDIQTGLRINYDLEPIFWNERMLEKVINVTHWMPLPAAPEPRE